MRLKKIRFDRWTNWWTNLGGCLFFLLRIDELRGWLLTFSLTLLLLHNRHRGWRQERRAMEHNGAILDKKGELPVFHIFFLSSPLRQPFCRPRPLRNWRFWHGKKPRAFRTARPNCFSTQVLEELRHLPSSHRFWHLDVCIVYVYKLWASHWCILLLAMNAYVIYPSLHQGPFRLWHDSRGTSSSGQQQDPSIVMLSCYPSGGKDPFPNAVYVRSLKDTKLNPICHWWIKTRAIPMNLLYHFRCCHWRLRTSRVL